jgi:N-acyl-D-aspartate/D-glutamate deacylase
MFDVVIRGVNVIDGSGSPGYRGDIGINDGKIAEIGRISSPATRVIDADGLVAAPGFIDIHTHFDPQITWDPYGTPSIFHGVTSVIAGNCGLSVAPIRKGRPQDAINLFARVEAMDPQVLENGVPWAWETTGEYLHFLEERGLGVNFGMNVGHSALRQFVMGEDSVEREQATPEEMAEMKRLLREAMEAGAMGFTTSLNPRHSRLDGKPTPGRFAPPAEFWELATVCGEMNRGLLQYAGGPRGEAGTRLLADKSIELGRPVIGVTIRHFWSRPTQWRDQLVWVEDGLKRGARCWAATNVRTFIQRFSLADAQEFDELPTWRSLMFLPLPARKEALRQPEMRQKLRFEAVEDPTPTSFSKRWDLIYVLEAKRPEHKGYEGKSIAEVAAERGQDVIDAFLDMSLEEDLEMRFWCANSQGDPAAVAEMIASPAVAMGQSDAGAHTSIDAGYGYCTLLLGYWVREKHAMRLEDAVRKLTFDQAARFEIPNRGLLKPGMQADVTLFDPATVGCGEATPVKDYPAGATRMTSAASGVPYVLVNGAVTVDNGHLAEACSGQLLKSAPI